MWLNLLNVFINKRNIFHNYATISLMKNNDSKVRALFEGWRIGQIRATFFGEFDIKIDPKTYWINGVSIDKETSNPKTGQKIIEGSKNNQKIALVILPIRMDLIVTPPETTKIESDNIYIPDLGFLNKTGKDFSALIKVWLMSKNLSTHNFNRVAYGIDLIMKAPSTEEAYKKISEYLPFKVDAKDSSDFIYQINKPIESKKIKKLKINRLTQWEVLKFNAEISSGDSPEMKHKYPDVRYCHLKLDINNVPASITLKNTQALDLFNELSVLGSEISEKGIK